MHEIGLGESGSIPIQYVIHSGYLAEPGMLQGYVCLCLFLTFAVRQLLMLLPDDNICLSTYHIFRVRHQNPISVAYCAQNGSVYLDSCLGHWGWLVEMARKGTPLLSLVSIRARLKKKLLSIKKLFNSDCSVANKKLVQLRSVSEGCLNYNGKVLKARQAFYKIYIRVILVIAQCKWRFLSPFFNMP